MQNEEKYTLRMYNFLYNKVRHIMVISTQTIGLYSNLNTGPAESNFIYVKLNNFQKY